MANAYKGLIVVPTLVALLALSACGPGSQTVRNQAVSANLSGLQRDNSQAPTLVYKRPEAPSLAAYSRFIIDPVRVDYRDPEMKEIAPEDIGRMQRYFQNAMIKELRDAGYQVGTRSQAKTLRVSLTISGLKAPNAIPNVIGVLAPIAISVGEVTVEGVFRESLTNRIDAVVIDRSQGSRVLNASPWSTWSDVESAFDNWAEGLREAIDRAHGR